MQKVYCLSLLLLCSYATAISQQFTYQDTLRGSVTPERVWWDLLHYDLSIKVNPADSTLKGQNTIRYQVIDEHQRMQIDLQAPMMITKVEQHGKTLKFDQEGNAWFVSLDKKQRRQAIDSITVHYKGKPVVSKRPPWSGGLSWKKDENSNDFIVTTCQGDGASLWWPCKDHMYDETDDGMIMRFTVPEHLTAVGNGRLIDTHSVVPGMKTFVWQVKNPINNYGVNLNVGDYIHFGEQYDGETGALDLDYYVLSYNLKKAKAQFKQVPMLLDAFEHWFGPYPFYDDSFKIVEVPYPGMEHQSSVTYGNGYRNGYGFRDVSGTGWGLNFDFILVHESGHEWFANNITYKDMADMWVHEGFTAYSEGLYLDYHYGKDAASEYVIGTRQNIRNDKPIIGPYGVNKSGSGDMYSKGANLLHTIRTLIDNDEAWRNILRGLNKDFYHETVTTQEIETYISKHAKIDLSAIFDQYLRQTEIPTLVLTAMDGTLSYQWQNCIDSFDMGVSIFINGEKTTLNPTTTIKQKKIVQTAKYEIESNPNYYINYDIK